MLAIYLAKEVAAILRAILTHPTKRLYDDRTAHLLCSNYWMQPISGTAAFVTLQLKPSPSGTRFTDWIGGICYADTLQVWFPAHWAPVVLRQLQHTEDAFQLPTHHGWT